MERGAGVRRRVVVAAPLYPPEIGGPATYVRMLEEELPQHGCDLTVVPFTTVRHLPKGVRHMVYFGRLLKAAWGKDLVYALDPVSVGVPAWLTALVLRKPLFVRLGGDYAWEQGRQRYGLATTLDEYITDQTDAALPVRVLAAVQSFVVRSAKAAIVPSEYMQQIVSAWGVPVERIKVVYSSLNPIVLPLQKRDYRRKLGLQGKVIVSAGRLVPWKGFDVLIDVAAQLRSDFPELTLIIAGDGPQKAALHEQIATANLSEHVRLLGAVSRQELGEYVKAADAFVLNTAYEGLSHQLLEVMDLGTAIVTTNVGGNPELITNEVEGFTVAFNDAAALETAIKTILTDEQRARELAAAANAKTEKFTKSASLSRLLKVLG